jgi:hypothetical protein
MKNIFNNKIKSANFIPTIENYDFDINSALLETYLFLEEKIFLAEQSLMVSEYYSHIDSNQEILQEGFNDFLKSAKDFFLGLLKSIRELFAKFFTYVKSFITEFDKFINDNKDKILEGKIEFSMNTFMYTITESLPDLSKIHNIISHYNYELEQVIKENSTEKVVELRNEYNTPLFFNKLRAEVIGKSGEIATLDFHNELFRLFRNDEKEKKETIITNQVIKTYMTDYSNMKKMYKEFSVQQNEFVRLINDLVSFFDKGVSLYYKENQKVMGLKKLDFSQNKITETREELKYNIDQLNILSSFYNYKFQQSKELLQIASVSTSTKITAIKEAMQQYQTAIRRAIYAKEAN